MAGKITPGPWFVDQQGAPTVRTADGSVICGVPSNYADAYLIAASPRMLANLREAQQWIARGIAEGAFEGCALPLAPARWLERVAALVAEIEKGEA